MPALFSPFLFPSFLSFQPKFTYSLMRICASYARPTHMSRHICSSVLKYFHEQIGEGVRHGATVSRAGRPDAPAALELDDGYGDMCLFFRRSAGDEPAEDFASPGLPAQGGCGHGAPRGQVDALPDRRAAR